MTDSLRALLAGAIDYAGMFPPARLGLEEAAANYVRYARLPSAWMLGHFVIPATHLAELSKLIGEPLAGDRPWSCAALGRGDDNPACWLPSLEEDAGAIRRFLDSQAAEAVVPVFEVRLPALADLTNRAVVEELLSGVAARVRGVLQPPPLVFCEIPRGANWLKALSCVTTALSEVGRREEFPFAFKLRTGGVTAREVPPVVEVADAVCACRDRNLRWKATAGLHYPLRGYREEVHAGMHGFLNLLVASVLAHSMKLSHEMVTRILQDEVAANFDFGRYFLAWRGTSVDLVQIKQVRQAGLQSFGSCSFEEPMHALEELEVVAAAG